MTKHVWSRILVATAIAGVAISCACVYLVVTYPTVRPVDWQGDFLFYTLVAIAKWGSFATITFGAAAYMKLTKSWLNRTLLASAFSPAITIIGLFITWLILLA